MNRNDLEGAADPASLEGSSEIPDTPGSIAADSAYSNNHGKRADGEDGQSLAARVSAAFKRSVRDNLIAEFGAQAVRGAGIVVLARLLTPADFGIMKALLAVSMVAELLIQAGVPDALVQRQQLDLEHECAGWWMNLAISVMTVAALYGGAGRLAAWMEMPELKTGIRLLCLPIFFEGVKLLSSARLERDLRFGALALADLVAEVGFVVGAAILLVLRVPRWSLVAGLAVRSLSRGLTIWAASPRIPLKFPRLSAIRDLASFAVTVWGGRIVQAVSDNSEYLLIGRLLGSSALGLYGMARDVLRFLPNRLNRVAGRVTFSAFCRLQSEPHEVARLYARYFNVVVRISLPLIAVVAATAPDLVKSVYGHRWLASAAPLQLLALGAALASSRSAISAIYLAKGYPSLEIYLNGLRLVLVLSVLFVLRHTGLLAISAGISAVEIATAVAAHYVAGWFTGLSLWDMLRESMPGIRLAIICSAVALLADSVCHHFEVSGIVALALALFAAAVVYVQLEKPRLKKMIKQGMSFQQKEPTSVEVNIAADAV